MAEKLIKSKERVAKFAEVFTPSHIVKKMVDLIDKEMGDEDYAFKTWFDPAVGTGNFPVEILERKLKWCDEHNIDNKNKIRALSSIYAVDIQEDNVIETRQRLLDILMQHLNHPSVYDIAVAESVLEANIMLGDTINRPEDIIFLVWNEQSFPYPVGGCRLSDMVGEDIMKDIEKRRKAKAKKLAKTV